MERSEIWEILLDWNFWGNYKEEWIERKAYLKKLEEAFKTGEIVVVKGVRRAGKSCLVTHFISSLIGRGLPKEKTLIVNFEDPRFKELNLEILNKIYEFYLDEFEVENPYVVLDEVQSVDGWEKFARFLSEAKHANLIVTGSSSKLLSEEYATLLAGRHVELEIFPLSFEEFLLFKGLSINSELELMKNRHKIRKLLYEYLDFGGFPKVALVPENQKKLILEGYFRDILVKDVQKRFKVREIEKLEALTKYYLTNIARVHSFSKIARVFNLSVNSVERFSKYFEIARFLFFVPKFSYSLKVQQLNPKKVYCIDLGLRNIASTKTSPDFGARFENVVFLHIFRNNSEVYYWKDYSGKEVDFVVKKDAKIEQLIQVCYNVGDHETKERELKALLKAGKELNCNNLLVVTEDYEAIEEIKGKKIKFVPLWKFLLNLS